MDRLTLHPVGQGGDDLGLRFGCGAVGSDRCSLKRQVHQGLDL